MTSKIGNIPDYTIGAGAPREVSSFETLPTLNGLINRMVQKRREGIFGVFVCLDTAEELHNQHLHSDTIHVSREFGERLVHEGREGILVNITLTPYQEGKN